MASTASLSPLTTCRMPSGRPASCISSASISGTEGSRSEGLRMKALPQARAGHIFHSGIIAGKLKGVMPATTPSGWRIEYMSMPGPAPSVNSPFRRCGAPMQNSATSRPRMHVALGVGEGLAVLAGQRLGELVHVAVEELDELHHHPGAALRVGRRPLRLRARGARDGGVELGLGGEGTRACTSPVAGLKTSAKRPERPATRLPSMKWPSSCMVLPRVALPHASADRRGAAGTGRPVLRIAGRAGGRACDQSGQVRDGR